MWGILALAIVLCLPNITQAQSGSSPPPVSGRDVYARACSTCHGVDGRGVERALVGFAVPVPDFTLCTFSTREPDPDWFAVVHDGGPTRAFDAMMPAFGEALTRNEIERAVDYVRDFCPERRNWPAGDLNLPRPLITEKAFPEDEAVVTTTVNAEGAGGGTMKFVYEKRLGPRSQWEVALPFSMARSHAGTWSGGAGDLALGFKHVVAHSKARGSVFSVAGELVLPTGDEDDGVGKGVAVFEPFIAFGQVLPGDGFVQFQGGFEVPIRSDHARDAFWRTAIGKTFTQGRFGRAWSPLIEITGARELRTGEKAQWDVTPGLQVTLSTRQHIMLALGVRLPVTDAGPRATRLVTYVLWDWFDGGLFEGW
jgi:mono/diheme cytochrome c family protein